ncbi:hypothetical protein CPB83DRAFT_847826 [Crepidotus variabilis]|uniref:Uncharacterized protein n=1 Tax=Crepidotus variabilis TaxID=179855 RepID=A0A9P6ENY4_9AGAR|nr:hypothetical protein CPB83DRAFT_847826 [Crepidotus variabilis]
MSIESFQGPLSSSCGRSQNPKGSRLQSKFQRPIQRRAISVSRLPLRGSICQIVGSYSTFPEPAERHVKTASCCVYL